MFVPLFAASLVIQVAAADGMPRWDVSASCKGAAEAAGPGEQGKQRMKGCLDSEERTRVKLEKEWTTFPATDKTTCIRTIQWFEPTYTELAACLEMARDAKAGAPPAPVKPKR